MSEVSTDSEYRELLNLLEDRENELNELLDKMDQLQSEVDDYNSKINDINFELTKCKQEQTRVKLINKNLSLEPKHIKRHHVDESTFSEEYLDLLKSKRDVISHLEQEISKLQEETQPIDDLVAEYQRENTVLLFDQSDTQKQIQKYTASKKRLKEDMKIANEQLTELKIRIQNQERINKDVEITVSGLITRKEAIISQTDPSSVLSQKINSLRVQTELAEMHKEEIENDIQKYEDDLKSYEEDMEEKVATLSTQINWKGEKQKLEDELKDVQHQLDLAKQETKEIDGQTIKIEKRYNKLSQIYNQTDPKIQISDETRAEYEDKQIDELIKEYRKLESSNMESIDTSNASLQNVIDENSKLELQIARKKDELERAVPKFAAEKAQLKNEIRINRINAFEREHQLIEQIKNIKIKIASRKPKR